jgi:Tol biopolymer transport system component
LTRRRTIVAVVTVMSLLALSVYVATPAFAATSTMIVTLGGTGTGVVTSDVTGISCPPTCSFDFQTTDVVTLTANPDPGSDFTGWGGDCSADPCTLTMDTTHEVSATFTLQTRNLTVTRSGTGSGTVSGGPINCPGTCSADLNYGTNVTLTANPNSSSTFTGWSGDCSGTGTCSVTMNADHTVDAQFTPQTQHLTVIRSGSGSGTVSGGPISCPTTCSADPAYGSTVNLTANADPGSRFAGWSGSGCSGTGTCSLTMNADHTVTAQFITVWTLTVIVTGSGLGSVAIAPGGTTCPSACTPSFDTGTSVTLTETPGGATNFTGWSGAGCAGSATTCHVTMSQARSVTATFTLKPHSLAVRKKGTGRGTVTSTPTGIDCGTTCGAPFKPSDTVILHVRPELGSVFTGWKGACTGKKTCSLPMNVSRSVTAIFTSVCGRIAFVSTRFDPNGDIVTMGPLGQNVVNLNKDHIPDSDPSWSPDCSKIAFTRGPSGHADIFVMNSDGTGAHRLTSGPDDTQPDWAPAGLRLVFTGTAGGNTDLYEINANGTHRHRITDSRARDFRPAWSPNGRAIAFVSSRAGGEQIFTIGPAGGSLRQLTHTRAQNLQPAWSPSSGRITFTGLLHGNKEIYVMGSAGGHQVRITSSPGIDAHPSFAPRGLKIVFYSNRRGNDEIYTMDANGSHQVDISRNPADDTSPVWRP